MVVSNLQPPFITAVFFNKKPMEEKMKQIDETAGRLGVAMRRARRVCRLAQDEAAVLLRVTPAELAEYECGRARMPYDVMEHVFLMGYKMMHVRMMERSYRNHRNIFRKIKNAVAEMA